MSSQFCRQSFRIDFQNTQFEIFIPKSNENLIHLSINDIRLTKTNSSAPLMIINENQNSFLLIEQSMNTSYARQTANLTVIFNHQVRRE